MKAPNPDTTKRHLLTVMLEDYFHVRAFSGLIQRGQWYRFETRFEQNTLKTLDLLDRFNIKATFFVLGWVADKQPEIIREVAKRGHELASRGLYYRSTRQMTPAEFREDLSRSRDALETASGKRVLGYRAARCWPSPDDLWKLDVLAEEGYAYDSSLAPISRAFRSESWRRFAHLHHSGDKKVWELPISTYSLCGRQVLMAGGNYFRQFPHALLKQAVEHWHKNYDAPLVMYTHIWELDPEQPQISGASPLARFRHYRNLDKMSWVLEDYFKKYSFVGIADYLGLSPALTAPASSTDTTRPVIEIDSRVERRRPILPALSEIGPGDARSDAERIPVTIVVPCFNEELSLPYLANTLQSVEQAMSDEYEMHFIFVDDCSRDDTFNALHKVFGSWSNCTLVRHKRNLGVAAAILNGIRHAETEIVCSIDCDCTYDPHELRHMIPRLTEDVDMVTASPYHPQGRVRYVPGWRLCLSKGASFLYRHVLKQKLFTYTSCFRVYRRSALVNLRLRETGFLGVAETTGRLDLGGSQIVEHPATLEVRLFGYSKMKIFRTIAGHLKLLTRLLVWRAQQKMEAAKKARNTNLEPESSLEFMPSSSSHITSESST
jgi:polysaccharide deacetylase family protein (PEP-CTERM system associated)